MGDHSTQADSPPESSPRYSMMEDIEDEDASLWMQSKMPQGAKITELGDGESDTTSKRAATENQELVSKKAGGLSVLDDEEFWKSLESEEADEYDYFDPQQYYGSGGMMGMPDFSDEDDFAQQIQDSLSRQIQDELSKQIQDELSRKIHEEIQRDIDKALQEELDKQLEEEFDKELRREAFQSYVDNKSVNNRILSNWSDWSAITNAYFKSDNLSEDEEYFDDSDEEP